MSATTKQPAPPAVKATAQAVNSRKPPSTAMKMSIRAPVEAAAPIPSKQPQSTAPAGSWAKKLPALTKSSSTAGSAAPSISAGGAPRPAISQTTAASALSVPAGAGGDSGNQASALSTNGIISFGNGLLDLVEGYEYNEEQIMTFLNTVYNTKRVSIDARYVAKGIQDFILTANNKTTETLATLEPPKNPNNKAAVHKNAEELRKASEAQLQGPKSFASVPSIPLRTSTLRDLGKEMPTSKDVRLLPYLGVNLPMVTVYDYLAWLLSALGSAETKGAEKSEKNYYLPLLALFSRWCTVISNLIKFRSLPMVHISWWGANVLLGSTLGDVPKVPGQKFAETKETLYIQPRQRILNGLGLKQPSPDDEGKQNYGHCAETFLFIVAGTIKKFPTASVHGFAMIPPELEELPINRAIKAGQFGRPINKIGPENEIETLANSVGREEKDETLTYQNFLNYQTSSLYRVKPCKQSCQAIFEHMRWDWTKNFVGVAADRRGQNEEEDEKDNRQEVPPPSKNPSEALGVGGGGGTEPPDFTAKLVPKVPEPFAAPLNANLTPGQRHGNTQAVKVQNKNVVTKSSKKKEDKLTEKNMKAAYGTNPTPSPIPTPSQMVGSTMATIASSAVSAAAPVVLAHVASAWGK